MNFWKQKLAAFLHDPPSKCLDIPSHGERSDAAFRRAGFTDETEIGEYFKHADHTGAAADRLPFPQSRSAGLQCAFDGVRNSFLHPLGDASGRTLRMPFHAEFRSAELGIEGEESVQPVLRDESLNALKDDDERWRARFFTHWRLWRKHAIEKDYRLGFLPADTRIPDHSIWTHMQVVSALAGCITEQKQWRPAFLKFQIGPVQEFIAAARSIRDLWSGSYLLSWLMAAGLKSLSEAIGPDAVIFPNLHGQPLFDLHWRKELWGKVRIGNETVWESLKIDDDRSLLTPNLPNVFLAVVPADQGPELAGRVEKAIREEWRNIANAVWQSCEKEGLTADEGAFTSQARKQRYDSQVARFLNLSWRVTPWPETLDQAMAIADGIHPEMPIRIARDRVAAVIQMAQEAMPIEHRDRRYYTDDSKTRLNNIGLAWSILLGLNSWELDAVRQTRSFAANTSGGWSSGVHCNKDSLTGQHEAVAGGRVWAERAEKKSKPWISLFKHDDWMGAATLIKRLWHFAYLRNDPWNLKTDPNDFPMPNTRGIAMHEPEKDCGDDDSADDAPVSEKYFAVLAFDGDEIGKWISGGKTPPNESQLADYRDGSGNASGAIEYFTRESDPDGKGKSLKERYEPFLKTPRALSPSYHLQFSEALSNFALRCVRPIVEVFDGRLIYAGGDDVVALLPADTALECARALRMGFRGEKGLGERLKEAASELKQRHEEKRRIDPRAGCLMESRQDGVICRMDCVNQQDQAIPFLVPGPAADCSVGIAIAHFKAPLQDVVRAAQAAEKRAKRPFKDGGLNRSAVAVTLMKRSGEIIEWGSKWGDGGLDLYREISGAMEREELSSKFPHRVIELVEPYLNQKSGFSKVQPVPEFDEKVDEIIAREFGVAVDRQRGKAWRSEVRSVLKDRLQNYMSRLRTGSSAGAERKVKALIGLCQTVAFAQRTGSEEEKGEISTPQAEEVNA